jgi:hypothetical protein
VNLFFWRRRKIARDLKAVTEVAGDQLSPGVGTFAIVLGGLVVTGVAAYVFHQKRKQKGRRDDPTASSKTDKPA